MTHDLTSQQFGRLTAQWPAGFNRWKVLMWLCLCECGNLRIVPTGNLLYRPGTRSCGCLRRETSQSRMTTHGHAKRGARTVEYQAYKSARQRCNSHRKVDWPNYGGRGIKFLFASFPEFLAALGPRPTPQHSLDRINNNGNYEAGNVRWATHQEQVDNRRLKRLEQFSITELETELQRRKS